MIDSHFHPENWGVRPVLFHIGGVPIPAYEFFVTLAIVVGALTYFLMARNERKADERSVYIVVAAFVGGALGAKIPVWVTHAPQIIAALPDVTPLLAGRTVVGGLIGGWLAVVLTKRRLGMKEKRGNLFAPAVAIGVAIGRLGCFFRGCCYGTPTSLPWGVDFGDSIMRHPTQLYESLFSLIMFVYFMVVRKKKHEPGHLFWLYLVWYFSFRFLVEFIRVEGDVWGTLSSFQLVSLAVLVFLFREHLLKVWKWLRMKISS